TRGGKESPPSEPLTLAVQALAQDDLLDAKPKILQAANNGEGPELDLSTISADATCWLGTWPLIAPDQDVWLRLKGTKADGTTGYNWSIWAPPPKGPRVNPTWINRGEYNVAAPYAYLKELQDGSVLTMEFKVDFSQTIVEANAQIFPLRTYTVKAVEWLTPTLTDIIDSKGTVVGGSTVETSVTVTGTGSNGQQIQLMDGTTNIGTPVSIPTGSTTWTTTLTGLTAKAYSLKAKALYGTGQESAAKAFNVTAVVAPTLTDIRDSKGSVVDKFTVETSVTVTGTGSSGQQIQLMDGTTNIGTPVSIPTGSTTWTTTL
ncbi:hypothetical protein HU806_26170, partial [Pseudomonas sp. SWRI154]|nr:hypothetical protein [Pseudomonas sp. SWRI154]